MILVGTTLVGTGAIFLHRDVIPDKFLHQSTAQEQLISDAYGQVLNETVDVLCLPQAEINDRVWPFNSSEPGKVKRAATVPFWRLVWINENICRAVTSFAQKTDKMVVTGIEVDALRALAHEASHLKGNIFSEGRAECEAVQYAEPLARALGSSAATALEVRKQVAQIVGDPLASSKDYEIPEGCVDGGPLDLDPDHPGVFPDRPTGPGYIKGW
jgi:hypothetical protein